MTPKQRIIIALRNDQPDRVPVTLGLSEMVPVRKSGLSYIDYFWRDKRNLNRDRCDTEAAYGADVFLHSCEGPAPDDPPLTTRAMIETDDEVVYEETIHTRAGDLTAVKRITPTESVAHIEGFVKHPADDRNRVVATLAHPEEKNFDAYLADWEYVGDAGHCGYWLPTPIDWWSLLRGTPEKAIYDCIDHGPLISDLFAEYTAYAVAMVTQLLHEHGHAVDSIGLGGSSTSMSVISPDLLDRYTTPFVRAIKAVAEQHDVPVQYHMCGRSRQAIGILVDAGVDGMDALESPPTGNVDLAEVKRSYGDRISLRGNVNSITVMLNGTTEDVVRDVVRCMTAARDCGGFILGVGDQTPYATQDENIYAMVEAGLKYGRY